MRLLIIALALLALFYLLTRGSTRGWIAENRWKLLGRSRRRYSIAGSYWEAPGAGSAGSTVAAFGRRLWSMRGLLSIFPQLRQILGLGAAGAGAAHAHQRREAPNQPMTTKRAAEILGITEDASPAEIEPRTEN